MRAGKLRHLVHFTRRRPGVDEVGQPLLAFDPVFDAWASVEPLTGRETFVASTMVASVDTVISFRFAPDTAVLTAQDRATVDGAQGGVYDVQAVLAVEQKGDAIRVLAKKTG